MQRLWHCLVREYLDHETSYLVAREVAVLFVLTVGLGFVWAQAVERCCCLTGSGIDESGEQEPGTDVKPFCVSSQVARSGRSQMGRV